MGTINIELDKSQFKKIIDGLNIEDKLEIYNSLKKSLFLKRYNSLLKSLKSNDLTMEEIDSEVEAVRQKRYEEGKQVLENNH
jgi:hypothetical protein